MQVIENEGAQRKIQHLAWVTFSNSWSTVVLNFKTFLNLGGPAGGLGHRKVATPMGARLNMTRKASLALQAWRVIWVQGKSWFWCYEIMWSFHTTPLIINLFSHTGFSWGWRLTILRYVSWLCQKLSSWLFLWPKIIGDQDFFFGDKKVKNHKNSKKIEKIHEHLEPSMKIHKINPNGSLRPCRSRAIFQRPVKIKFLTSLRK